MLRYQYQVLPVPCVDASVPVYQGEASLHRYKTGMLGTVIRGLRSLGGLISLEYGTREAKIFK